MPLLIYICGPYHADTAWEREQNVRRAEELAREVALSGDFPVCPHSNTRPYFEGIQDDEFWYEGTMELMKRCDGIALVEGYSKSMGALREAKMAAQLDMPLWN